MNPRVRAAARVRPSRFGSISKGGPTGAPLSINRYVVLPGGQRPLTLLGLALGVERLLGLRGDVVVPGIYTPEVLLDPAYVVKQLVDVGITFVDA